MLQGRATTHSTLDKVLNSRNSYFSVKMMIVQDLLMVRNKATMSFSSVSIAGFEVRHLNEAILIRPTTSFQRLANCLS